MSLAQLVTVVYLLLLISLPLTIHLTIAGYRRLRGRRSPLTRVQLRAKYRYLALFGGVLFVYLFLFSLPRLFVARGSAWNLLGLPAAFAWLLLGPKPAKPTGRMPAVPVSPEQGQGIVLTRQEDPLLFVALPVYIDRQRVGVIRRGRTLTYELDPGAHTPHLKPGRGTWGRTQPETVLIEPRTWSQFECGESTERLGPKLLRHPECQIWIRATAAPAESSVP